MYRSGSRLGVLSTAMLGIGSMVGGGIFAILGDVADVAGSAAWVSFLISGLIALVSGYSLARLGVRYPSAGGLVEYLVQGWGEGLLSGALSILLYVSGLVGMALVARAFGTYATAWMPASWHAFGTPVCAVGLVLVFLFVNLGGARGVARVEDWIVAIKLGVLLLFAVAGLWTAQGARLAVDTWPPAADLWSTVALSFFAYTGYSVIANTAEDMQDPARTLPRAMLGAIGAVMALYLLVAVVVLGNLPPERIAEAREYALAEAARPVFGASGFALMSVAAMVSTASSLNANLYATANIAWQMARHGELPEAFATPIAHSSEGLVFSSFAVCALVAVLDLHAIAALGAVSMLIVQAFVHVAHLRLLRETGADGRIVLAAVAGTVAAGGYALWDEATRAPRSLGTLVVALMAVVALEVVARRGGRVVRARVS